MSEANGKGGATLLRVDSVTAGYGRTTVLRNVSVEVGPSSVVALMGPNGAGKTTLLRCIAGLLGVGAGSISFAGDDLGQLGPVKRARAGLCLVPEGRGVFPHLTVAENLRLQLPRRAEAGLVDEAYDAFPILRDRRGQRAGTMSGGEQQMLALARCFLARPSLVLLDEVSMGLAPRIVDQIFESIMGLARRGVSLLLVEQYVNRALEMADYAYVLHKGEVRMAGAASSIDEAALLREYLGGEVEQVSGEDAATEAPAPPRAS
jgi:branched-chain amino acid transport system ATP-binding protein